MFHASEKTNYTRIFCFNEPVFSELRLQVIHVYSIAMCYGQRASRVVLSCKYDLPCRVLYSFSMNDDVVIIDRKILLLIFFTSTFWTTEKYVKLVIVVRHGRKEIAAYDTIKVYSYELFVLRSCRRKSYGLARPSTTLCGFAVYSVSLPRYCWRLPIS